MNIQHAKRDNKTPFRILLMFGLGLVALTIAALFLVGCSSSVVEPSAEAAVAEQPEVEPPAENHYLKQFGDVITWDDGLSVSVSEPVDYSPTDTAQGATPGQDAVLFTVTLTNDTDEAYNITIYPTASSGEQEATQIFDIGHSAGEVGMFPMTPVLPGESINWLIAFSVADESDILVSLAPGINYEDGLFTNKEF